jgi:hypothetical protein
MNSYSNPYARQICDILTPIIGDLMSQGALKSQCSKLGIGEETIRKEHLSPLAEGLRKGLVLFLGTEGAQMISFKIAEIR